MKIKMLIVALYCFAPSVVASAAERAEIKAGYNFSYVSYQDTTKANTEKMTLLCNATNSKYFNEMSEYCDSMTSTPEGKKKLREIQVAAWMTQTPEGVTIDMRKGNAPRKKVGLYVFSTPETVVVYDKFATDLSTYSEPASEQQWEIEADSVKTILGYECVMARSDYHGRKWRAWFTPEIPVGFGPWKLRGLPGLIMEAEADGAGNFRFIVTGVEKSGSELTPIYSKTAYQKVDRLKALADAEYFINHKLEILSTQFAGTIQRSSNNNEPQFTSQFAIECDYDKP